MLLLAVVSIAMADEDKSICLSTRNLEMQIRLSLSRLAIYSVELLSGSFGFAGSICYCRVCIRFRITLTPEIKTLPLHRLIICALLLSSGLIRALQLFSRGLLTYHFLRLHTKRIMESEMSSLKDEVRALRGEVGRLRGTTPLSLLILD
jgi:hypothetical protein